MYSTVEIPAYTLLGPSGAGSATVRGLALAGGQLKSGGLAVSINPTSELREVVIFFDSEAVGRPLVAGQVLRAPQPFSTLQVAAPMPATMLSGTVTLTDGSAGPKLARQTLRLDVWHGQVPGRVEHPLVLSVEQERITFAAEDGAVTTERPILFLHAPGLRSLVAWASNDNSPGTMAATLKVKVVRPQVGLLGATATTIRYGRQLGTLTVPSSADASARVELVQVDPGAREYVITTTTTNAGTQNLTVGFEGVWS